MSVILVSTVSDLTKTVMNAYSCLRRYGGAVMLQSLIFIGHNSLSENIKKCYKTTSLII